jgi:transcription-repair coupling factor (superfamily II helicase)
MTQKAEIEGFAAELIDRFGPLPEEVTNLIDLMEIKRLCRIAGIERLEAGPKGAVISLRNNSFARPDKLVAYIQRHGGAMKLRPDQKLVYLRGWEDGKRRIAGARRLVGDLADLVV